MMRPISLSVLGLLMIAGASSANYDELTRELEAFEPKPYLLSSPGANAASTQNTASDERFEQEVQALKELKAAYAAAFKYPSAEKSFYLPTKHQGTEAELIGTSDEAATAAISGSLALSTLDTLVFTRNRGIRSAAQRRLAALESISQVTHLDEILRSYSVFTESVMTGIGPAKGKDTIRNKFPFPATLALKGRVAAREVDIAHENFEITVRDAITKARTAWWNLLYIRRATEVTSETLALLHRMESVATVIYESGKTSFQDVIRIRVKRETLAEKLVTYLEKEKNLHALLLQTVDLPIGTQVGALDIDDAILPTTGLTNEATLGKIAQSDRQELKRMRAMIYKMESMIEMSATMIIPPFTLGFSFYDDQPVLQTGTGAMKSTFATTTTASMGAGLPKMPWYGVGDAYLNETRRKLSALQNSLVDAETKTATMVRMAWFELDLAGREFELFDAKLIELTRAALDVSLTGYEAGKATFADVIGSYTGWLQTSLALERHRADYGIAVARLEQVVGTRLSELNTTKSDGNMDGER